MGCCSGDGGVGGGVGGSPHDRLLNGEAVQPVGEGRVRRDVLQAGDLVEERTRLVDEAVVVAGADAGRVHRQPTGDVGVLDAHNHSSEAGGVVRYVAGGDLELARS